MLIAHGAARRLRVRTVVAVIGAAVAGYVLLYLSAFRKPCLTWGASPGDVDRVMPGDELLPEPDLLATRAVSIEAPPSAIWPWLVQMGSGRGGVYTYDWLENLFGLRMHSADEILPQYQDRKVGDVEQLGSNGPRMRVEVLDVERAMVWHSEDGNWVWAFGLYPSADGSTTLVSRNRIAAADGSLLTRVLNVLVMEPGRLVMERKMLLGIKQRAEALAHQEIPD